MLDVKIFILHHLILFYKLTLSRVNDKYTKMILLHLSKQANTYWTPKMLKQELKMDLEPDQIQQKLVTLCEADMIEQSVADIEFRGLQDGTLNLILRNRFEKEIKEFEPPSDFKSEFSTEIEDLKAENQKLRGLLNNLSGKMAEH